MNELIALELRAIGPEPDQQWRYRVEQDAVVRLGRAPQQGWAVPWDVRISREHADLMFERNRMFVSCLESARNPAYHQGRPTMKFAVEPGGEFRIGATTFRLQRVAVDSIPAHEVPDEAEESSTRTRIKQLQNKLAREDPRFQHPPEVEQNLQAVLELIDGGETDRADLPPEKPKSERDTTSTSTPQVGTATSDTLLRQLVQEQFSEQQARRKAEEQAREHRQEARVLRTTVDRLQARIKREVQAKQQAEEDARQIGEQDWEAERKAREQAEERARRSQQEAESLRSTIEELQQRIEQKVEAIQNAEQEAHRVALQAQEENWHTAAARSVDGGASFENYILLERICSGETDQMYMAQHTALGRSVALNILSAAAAPSLECVQRFRSKSQILARANHPNLVPIYDAGEREGIHYLVMEYIDGRNLIELLDDEKTLRVEMAVEITLQAARALQFLHAHGIVHRNVSPQNLLIDRQGVVKLIGLGQSLDTRQCELSGLASAKPIEETGPIGDFDYMPPEQAEHGGRVDCRADIYSLGCTMFTALTAQVVFPVDSPNAEMVAQRTARAPNLTRFREDVSVALDEIFQKMVHPDRDQRFASMEEVVERLQQGP